MKKLSRRLLLIASLIIALALAGCGSQDAVKEEAKPVPVSVVKVKTDSIANSTVITGKTTAKSEVMIVPKVGGRVTKVTVDVGSKVKKGALLVQLDTAELEAQLKQAQAALELARSGAAQYNYRLTDAKKNLEKMERLYKEGAVSKDQYDTVLLQYNILVNTSVGAEVQRAQGSVDYIKAQLDGAAITAPVDGEVSAKNIEVGELAGPGSPVLTIVDTSKVFVEGVVTEKDIPYITSGQQVQVAIDALGKTVEGTITALSPAADPRTKGYQVKVEINNPQGTVKPGMFAEIKLTTQAAEDTLVIPKEALVARGDKKVVFRIDDNTAREQDVTIGLEGEQKVEIVKGLKEGDQVVILGQQSLANKTKVVVKE